MDLSKKRQEVRDKETLEQRQNDARQEIAKLEKQSKVRRLLGDRAYSRAG
jgi:hypothetical protein